MTPHQVTDHPRLETASFVVGHVAAVVVGLVMMIVGLGLGVTMVLLPVGFGVGLFGVALFVWGLFGRTDERHVRWQAR
jgi:hypothetical protein